MRLLIRILTLITTLVLIPLICHFIISPHFHLTLLSNPNFTTTTTTTTTTMSHQTPKPIIIVGAGLAGLSASLSAFSVSPLVSIHVLERAPRAGGNSIKASSGISAAGTRFQQHHSHHPKTTQDSVERFYNDTVRSAGARLLSSKNRERREGLMGVLTRESAGAVEWLSDELGVDMGTVARLGGHSAARTHRGGGKTPPGAAIMGALTAKLKGEFGEEKEGRRFVLDTGVEVTRLLTQPGEKGGKRVTGVEFVRTDTPQKKETLLGPVVFASGGFAGDTKGLLARYRPDLAGLPSTNDARPGAHDVLAEAGAELVDMDSVQIHPTGFVDPANPGAMVKFLAAEMLRGEGGILLSEGRRFVNELDTREKISGKIMGELPQAKGEEEGGLKQWDVQLLLDPGAAEAAGGHVGFYLWKGLMRKVKVKELHETTRQTLEEYVKVVRGEKEDEFGRTSFGHWKLGVDGEVDPEAEVCVARVTPITHFTMGGALINEEGQVLTSVPGEAEKPIDGLWAAGEITGGIHGDNRLGGSSLLECVVFGRIAGQQAAKAALTEKSGE
ncbi:FAD binding domain-containing protein [Coniochaeta sp. 2T2.1]|nr:FAD binding domain-containing protein [Coniochaeta sp. 2T2.1]